MGGRTSAGLLTIPFRRWEKRGLPFPRNYCKPRKKEDLANDDDDEDEEE